MVKKRLTALILVFVLILSALPAAADTEEFASRLYTAEQFIYAIGVNNLKGADECNAEFTDWQSIDNEDKETLQIACANGILSGYEDSTIRPYDNILRIEAFVMLGRAIKDLPQTNEPLTFSDTPEWAKDDVDRLSAAGIIKGVEPGLLGAEDYITQEQVLILADRIDSIYTTIDKKDDFYEAVNAKWIRNNSLQPGYFAWSALSEAEERKNQDIKEIIMSYADEPEGSIRKKAYDYYLSAADMEKRNAEGAQPIKPYLEMLDAARSTSDILEVMANIAKDNYMFSLIPVSIGPDELDTDHRVVTLTAADTGMNAYYLLVDEKSFNAFREYLLTLFRLAGEDDGNLESRIDDVLNFEKTMAASALNYYEYLEFENRYNEYTPDSFKAEFQNIDLEHYFNIMGIELPNRFIVEEKRQMNVINSFMSDASANLLKDYIKSCLLCDSAQFLSQDFINAQQKFSDNFFTVEEKTNHDETALQHTDSMFGMLIGIDYMDKFYNDETTQIISDMTHELIETYISRINALDWLSDETKESAVKKLENMKIKIGGPETFTDYYSNADILSVQQGGNLFYNTAKISSQMFKDDASKINIPIDRDEWLISPQTVNAFYSPTNNEIILPAGILQRPMYSPDFSYEQTLGAIGTVIAHELSHAFDSSGALYDEKGNYKSWWTEEDFKSFEELSQKVMDRYSKIEVIKGQFVNGEYTLNENIADLGAMSCIIETASKHEGFNFDMMFESYAASWAEVIPDENLITTLLLDEHSPSKVRVNAVLQNYDKFYETYDIKSSDGMYLPPEERVFIW